jgi:2-polyprenyl-3-methyl-5-hydroxy-6-metoxy-1,4-benzoquinol methylase
MVASVEGSPVAARSLRLETVDCLFCGRSEYSRYDSADDWTIVKCRKCGLCFTNPRPVVESLSHFYTLKYFKDEDESRFHLFNEDGSAYPDKENGDHQRIADIESRFQKRGNLLEVGAATGGFLRAMRRRGWSVQGVELSHDAVEAAREYEAVDVFCGALEDYETEETFDVICMYHSLEHVPDPAYVIERSYQLLNPNGIVVIEVPNINSFDIKWSRKRKLLNYDLPLHLSHFTPEVLTERLRATGFKILDVDVYYPDFLLKLVEWWGRHRRATDESSPVLDSDQPPLESNEELPMAMKTSNWKIGLFRAVAKVFPGWRFTIVARK